MKTYEWMERDLRGFVNSIIAQYTIVDYAVVVSATEDTVDCQVLSTPIQKSASSSIINLLGVRLLYPSSKHLSIRWKLETGDRVILLATRNYVKDLKSVSPSKAGSGIHYDLENVLAFPISNYDDSAEVVLDIAQEEINLKAKKKINIEIDKDTILKVKGKGEISVDGDCTLKVKGKVTATAEGDIEATGNNVKVTANAKCEVNAKGGCKLSGSMGAVEIK